MEEPIKESIYNIVQKVDLVAIKIMEGKLVRSSLIYQRIHIQESFIKIHILLIRMVLSRICQNPKKILLEFKILALFENLFIFLISENYLSGHGYLESAQLLAHSSSVYSYKKKNGKIRNKLKNYMKIPTSLNIIHLLMITSKINLSLSSKISKHEHFFIYIPFIVFFNFLLLLFYFAYYYIL